MADNPNVQTSNMIDWNEMAKTFDRWLPYIQPVAEELLSLTDLSEGQEILDVAAGTGEPSLTIARRFKNKIKITGVDGAEAMVTAANKKAQLERLKSVTFLRMKAEALAFSAERFDRVISRFGVMLFDDPLRGVREMRRVLKPGGKMAIAVWGEFQDIRSIYFIWESIMKRLPQAERLPPPKMADLGAPGKLERLLNESGFKKSEIRPFKLSYRFDNFDSYWTINTESGTLKEPLDKMSAGERDQIKKEILQKLLPYSMAGKIEIENTVILAAVIK